MNALAGLRIHLAPSHVTSPHSPHKSPLNSDTHCPPDDIEALVIGSKYIKPMIGSIVTAVYRKLLQYDITSRSFASCGVGGEGSGGRYEGPTDDSELPSESSPQIQYRKLFLRGYLQKLCADPGKMEFWQYLDKVGYGLRIFLFVSLRAACCIGVEWRGLGA